MDEACTNCSRKIFISINIKGLSKILSHRTCTDCLMIPGGIFSINNGQFGTCKGGVRKTIIVGLLTGWQQDLLMKQAKFSNRRKIKNILTTKGGPVCRQAEKFRFCHRPVYEKCLPAGIIKINFLLLLLLLLLLWPFWRLL